MIFVEELVVVREPMADKSYISEDIKTITIMIDVKYLVKSYMIRP